MQSYFFVDPVSTVIRTLSLHDALPICFWIWATVLFVSRIGASFVEITCDSYFFKRSEEHTSELQSRFEIVCRRLLDKKNWLSVRDADLTDCEMRLSAGPAVLARKLDPP